jgi:hypothetical protein
VAHFEFTGSALPGTLKKKLDLKVVFAKPDDVRLYGIIG